jgi:hypothetical protein
MSPPIGLVAFGTSSLSPDLVIVQRGAPVVTPFAVRPLACLSACAAARHATYADAIARRT